MAKNALPNTLTMSTSEVAKALNKPIRTVQGWCERGELPATKIGKTWIVNTAKLAEVLGL